MSAARLKTYLFVPSMPTPNGRLHLGHIAGPFLRVDVAARFLRSRGHRAYVMTGTDPYESHVLLQAERERRTPRDVAEHYTRAIRRDLAAFDIQCDTFVDPLAAPYDELYARHNSSVLERLVEVGAARYTTVRWPSLAETGAFVPRSYLQGFCPSCATAASGSVCEACGQSFRAEELGQPSLRGTASALEWRDVRTLEFLLQPEDPRLEQIRRTIEALGLPSRYIAIAGRNIREKGAHAELTVPGTWGVPWAGAQGQVIYSYTTVYAWALLMRALCNSADEAGGAPAATDLVTITSFGVDITVPWVASPVAFAHLSSHEGEPRSAPYHHYWPNEFLLLHGRKFSTSRGHVIWAEALVESTPVTSDMARFHLATIDPVERETDFKTSELVSTVNDVVLNEIHASTDAALRELDARPAVPPSQAMAGHMARILDEQAECYALDRFRLDRAAALVRKWVQAWREAPRSASSRSDAYWFLKCLALLSAPLMPRFAGDVWSRLGGEGEPMLDQLQTPTAPVPGRFDAPITKLHESSLDACLPDTLKREPHV